MILTERLRSPETKLAETQAEIAEVRRLMAEGEKPWMPSLNDTYFSVKHDGIKWRVFNQKFLCVSLDHNFVNAGNCFRTESEAQEVADIRNFFTEYLSAGDLAPDDCGWRMYVDRVGDLEENTTFWPTVERNFSTREKLSAFIEKWGGEERVKRFLTEGWK